MFKTIVEGILWIEKCKTRQNRRKWSNLWRAPPDDFYPDLDPIECDNRRKRVISEIRSNKIKAQIIESQQIQQITCDNSTDAIFEVTRTIKSKQHKHTVNITNGYCNCHYFVHNQIPCIDRIQHMHKNSVWYCNAPPIQWKDKYTPSYYHVVIVCNRW